MGIPFFSFKSLIDKTSSGGGTGGATKTSELNLTSAQTESISGTATTQEEVNAELVSNIKSSLVSWKSTLTYTKDEQKYYNGIFWTSLQDSNTGNEPSDTSTYWTRTYKNNFSKTITDLLTDNTITNELNSKNILVSLYSNNKVIYTDYEVSETEIKIHFDTIPSNEVLVYCVRG